MAASRSRRVRAGRLPPPVRPGARVGVAALSGPVLPERLDAGLDALREMGLEPVLAANVRQRHGLFAGTDDQRLAGLHELAADSSIAALLFTRGGYGAQRLLPRLDWDVLGRVPRPWVGYSDLTPLLNLVVSRLGLVAFHGPMVGADLWRGLDGVERDSFLGALAGEPLRRFAVPVALHAGSARGVLLGGCLSLLTSAIGTGFMPSLRGAVLFWEDVGEPWYRLDRMLTHLRLSGTLTGTSAMVIGDVAATDAPPDEPDAWLASARELAIELGIPAAAGLAAGHRAPNLTLPLGARVRLDTDLGELSIERLRRSPGA